MAYSVDKLSTIDLGRQGENLARTVEIDVSSLLAQWPDAVISLLCKRKHDTVPYVAVTEVRDGILFWPITSVETEAAGDGKIELRAVCGEVIAKSMTAVIRVAASLTGSETEAPDAAQGWVDQVLAAGSGVEANAIRAEEAATRAEEVVADIGDSVERAQEASRLAGEEAAAAEASAEHARQVAEDVSAEAERIETAVADAELAAGKIDGMKVSAETLEPGLPATVAITDDGAVKTISSGIPKGKPGEKPVRGEDYWTEADKREVISEAVSGTLEQVKTISYYFCSESEVDENGQPVIAVPDDQTFYLVPSGEAEPNLFIEWVYLKERWELFGSATIDLSGYVKKTDYASGTEAGVVKVATHLNYGVQIDTANGFLRIKSASINDIKEKVSGFVPITPASLDFSVKHSLTTNTLLLTDEEQSAAQKWLGTGKIIAGDAVANDHTWSSQNMLDRLTIPFEVSGSIVQCHPVETSPLSVKTEVRPVQNIDWVHRLGDTTQVTTTGKNLYYGGDVEFTTYSALIKDVVLTEGETYTFSADVVSSDTDAATCLLSIFGAYANIGRGTHVSATFKVKNEEDGMRFYASTSADFSSGDTAKFSNIQIELGTAATAYEPYTGGKPSPSPEYPQPLVDSNPAGSYYVASTAPSGGYWRIDLDSALGGIGEYQDALEIDRYTGRYRILRRIQQKELTGDEDWQMPTGVTEGYSNFRCAPFFRCVPIAIQSEHLFGVARITYSSQPYANRATSFNNLDQLIIQVENTVADYHDQTDTSEWIGYLKGQAEAGTPVVIRYAVEEPSVTVGQATHVTSIGGLTALNAENMGLTVPDPDHPCVITVANDVDVVRCGKNLWNFWPNGTFYGVTAVSSAEDGTITLNGTSEISYNINQMIYLPTGRYLLSGEYENCGSSNSLILQIWAEGIASGSHGFTSLKPAMINCRGGNVSFRIHMPKNYTYSNTTIRPMLTVYPGTEENPKPTPYQGEKHNVILPESFNGGTVDMTGGSAHETYAKVVLDGTETWQDYLPADNTDTYFGFVHSLEKNVASSLCCSHLKWDGANLSGYYPNSFTTHVSGALVVRVEIEGVTSIDTWKAYLAAQHAAGIPVTIYYQLKSPNERSIGSENITALEGVNTIYSNAQSVTVSGRESPIHTIQTLHERIAALENAAAGN